MPRVGFEPTTQFELTKTVHVLDEVTVIGIR
jgi:hypothetical protein